MLNPFFQYISHQSCLILYFCEKCNNDNMWTNETGSLLCYILWTQPFLSINVCKFALCVQTYLLYIKMLFVKVISCKGEQNPWHWSVCDTVVLWFIQWMCDILCFWSELKWIFLGGFLLSTSWACLHLQRNWEVKKATIFNVTYNFCLEAWWTLYVW